MPTACDRNRRWLWEFCRAKSGPTRFMTWCATPRHLAIRIAANPALIDAFESACIFITVLTYNPRGLNRNCVLFFLSFS